MRRLGITPLTYALWSIFLLNILGMPSRAAEQVEIPSSALLTLEQAYDRALSADESIRIAFLEIRKARLLRWRALARFEPHLSGGLGYGRAQDDRWTSDRLRQGVSGERTAIGTKEATKTSLEQTIFKDQSTTETSLENSRAMDRFEQTRNYDETGSFSSRTNRGTGSIILEQPLLDLSAFPAYRLGKLAAHLAQLQFQFTVRDVLLGVSRAYYDVLKAEQLVRINHQAVELANKQLVLGQQRFDAGTALRTEVLRGQATVDEAHRNLVLADGELVSARDLLRSIVNFPGEDFRVCEPAAHAKPTEPIADLLSQAYRFRDDYKAGETAIAQEVERRNEVTASFAPRVSAQLRLRSLDLDGSGSGSGTRHLDEGATDTSASSISSSGSGSQRVANPPGSPVITSPLTTGSTESANASSSGTRKETRQSRNSSRFSSDQTEWEALLTVEMPLLGERSLERRAASYQVTEAQLRRERLQKIIEREVRDGVRQLETLAQTVKFLRSEVKGAEQNYEDLQKQYQAGVVTGVDLLVALRDLNRARTQLALDGYDLEFARCNLERATGQFQSARVLRTNVESFERSERTRAGEAEGRVSARAGKDR